MFFLGVCGGVLEGAWRYLLAYLGGCLGVFCRDFCGVLEGFRGSKRNNRINEKNVLIKLFIFLF